MHGDGDSISYEITVGGSDVNAPPREWQVSVQGSHFPRCRTESRADWMDSISRKEVHNMRQSQVMQRTYTRMHDA